MQWIPCGSVEPIHFEWKFFDDPLIGGEVFRLRHENAEYMAWGWAIFAFRWDAFGQYGYYGHKRVYPKFIVNGFGENYEIFTSPIPSQLIEINIAVRYAVIKLPARTPRTVPTWKLHLDALAY